MFDGGWPKLMNWKEQYAAPVTNSSFSTIINIGATQTPNLPANSLVIGTALEIIAWGTIGSAAGTATTTLGLMLNGGANGAAGGGTALAVTASETPATSTVLNWHLNARAVIVTEGSSGTIQTSGFVVGIGATQATVILMPTTQAAAAAINTTTANYINLTATWSTSASGNTYTVNGFYVKQLN